MRSDRRLGGLVGLAALLAPVLAFGGETGFRPASARDRCPVCGMFVAGYPNWLAEVVFKDGTVAVFDGPKDLLSYLSAMKRYEKTRIDADVADVYVMDYYGVKPIAARGAFFVTKSDVRGPMGEELVPFEKESDAAEFLRDHRGAAVVTFAGALAAVRAEGGP